MSDYHGISKGSVLAFGILGGLFVYGAGLLTSFPLYSAGIIRPKPNSTQIVIHDHKGDELEHAHEELEEKFELLAATATVVAADATAVSKSYASKSTRLDMISARATATSGKLDSALERISVLESARVVNRRLYLPIGK